VSVSPDYPQQRQRHVVSSLFLLLIIVYADGCTARRPSHRPPLPPSSLPSAQELLGPFKTRQQHLTGLRGLTRLTYQDRQERGSLTQAVAIAAPDRFRLELFSLLSVAAIHTCDGQTLAAYFPRDNVIYRGAANPLSIARFTRLMLSAREITRLLLGLPPFPVEGESGATTTVRLGPHGGTYRVDLPKSGGSVAALWFDTNTKHLQRWAVIAADGSIQTQGQLADYRQVQGLSFPFSITLSDTHGAQHISLVYKNVKFSQALPDSLFRLTPPQGVQEIDIDAHQPH